MKYSDARLKKLYGYMGPEKELLQYLPLDLVRISSFRDQRANRRNVLPYKMSIGYIPDSERDSGDVYALIYPQGNEDQVPGLRYNVFPPNGDAIRQMSVEDVLKKVVFAPPFQCLSDIRWAAKGERIDESHLRAVGRFYTMAKVAPLEKTWSVDHAFLEDLTSACKLAKKYQVANPNVAQPATPPSNDRMRERPGTERPAPTAVMSPHHVRRMSMPEIETLSHPTTTLSERLYCPSQNTSTPVGNVPSYDSEAQTHPEAAKTPSRSVTTTASRADASNKENSAGPDEAHLSQPSPTSSVSYSSRSI